MNTFFGIMKWITFVLLMFSFYIGNMIGVIYSGFLIVMFSLEEIQEILKNNKK